MSAKIAAAQFIARAEEIAAEGPIYKTGGDGRHGECDCIGLIMGAIRRAGGEWTGLHGSNYAARNELEGKIAPIAGTGDLIPGEAVFKAYEPGQKGYGLPEKYEKGGGYYNGDVRDYYHVGIVTSVYPLRIRHMSTGGAKMDTSIGKWSWHGKLKKISYNGEGTKTMQATVVLPAGSKGSTVNLRKNPEQKNGNVIAQVPVGTVIEVVRDMGQWCEVEAQGYAGYMMSNYIEYPGQGEEVEGDILTAEEREKIDRALLDIENRIEIIRETLGRG